MSTEIGLRIKALRRLKQVTQQELARRVNISVTMLSNIETGQKMPHPQLLQNIASSLSVPAEELLILWQRHAGAGLKLHHSRTVQ
ncbi:MAG: helix-turn-helix transcriptional regulator [Firmicutes bacterium]|nr:helix-turn-helix transcriptional regulator [Bacillota bacterium]